MRLLPFAFIILLAVACSHTKSIEIDSSPQGANVDFDGAYLGKTPIKQKVTRGRNEWSNRIYASRVKATLGACSETKEIGKDQETPDRIFFDFSICANARNSKPKN